MLKVIIYISLVSQIVDSYYGWIITDINNNLLNTTLALSTEVDDNQINIILPGTKWCGPGNIADGYDDLGAEEEADKCCRDHDNCPDTIPGGGTKHNLTNTAVYTRLNCACDNKFYKCLKAADTTTAKFIGVIYFDMIHTKCFMKTYPVTGCIEKGGWFDTKCVKHSFDPTDDKVYQWFDELDF